MGREIPGSAWLCTPHHRGDAGEHPGQRWHICLWVPKSSTSPFRSVWLCWVILFSNDRDKNINASIPMVDLGGWQGEHKRMVALQPSGALIPHWGGPSSGSQALHGQMMPRQIRSPFVSSKTTKVEESWRRSLEREAKWELAPSPFP